MLNQAEQFIAANDRASLQLRQRVTTVESLELGTSGAKILSSASTLNLALTGNFGGSCAGFNQIVATQLLYNIATADTWE